MDALQLIVGAMGSVLLILAGIIVRIVFSMSGKLNKVSDRQLVQDARVDMRLEHLEKGQEALGKQFTQLAQRNVNKSA